MENQDVVSLLGSVFETGRALTALCFRGAFWLAFLMACVAGLAVLTAFKRTLLLGVALLDLSVALTF